VPERICFRDGCTEPANDWAPVWRLAWENVEDEPRECWADTPFCAEHYPVAWDAAVRGRLDELVGPRPRMRGWSLATFPADDAGGAAAKAKALRWLLDEEEDRCWDNRNLVISGSVGAGKTSLAWSCLRAVVEHSPYEDVRFVNVRQLLADIRRSFSAGNGSDPTEGLVAADLLVLDDLGAERRTDWALETLATIIDGRYLAERSTVVTSNFTPAELAQHLGHDDPVTGLRIVSRLTEDAVQIHLDRPDLRRHHRRTEEA
jgi:DNA replication protein DnaC